MFSLVQEDIGNVSDGKPSSVSRSNPGKIAYLVTLSFHGLTSQITGLPPPDSYATHLLILDSSRDFQLGAFLPHKRHLVTFGDICGCHEWVGCYSHQVSRGQECYGHSTISRTAPRQNSSRANVEKLCCMVSLNVSWSVDYLEIFNAFNGYLHLKKDFRDQTVFKTQIN